MKAKSLRNIALRFNTHAHMSVAGIQETLVSAGCDSVTYSTNEMKTAVSFTRGTERYRININVADVGEIVQSSEVASHLKCADHAERVCLWAIRHLIEAQITCVVIGALSFEEAFFQFLLVNDEEALSTVFERALTRKA